MKYLKFFSLILIFYACNSKQELHLNKFQYKIKKQINNSKNISDFFNITDTIFLNVKSDSIDNNPIIKSSLKSIILANPYLKNIYKFDMKGNLLLKFGNDGDGPGEFRSILDVSIDEKENIYVYDFILGRYTKFDKNGKFIISKKVKNQNARHIASLNEKVFIHHAPLGEDGYFISIYNDNNDTIDTYINASNDYLNYFNRGFLDGDLVSDFKEFIYETNCYSYYIRKIKAPVVKQFGEKPEDYIELEVTKNNSFLNLTDYYKTATLHKKLFIINEGKIIIQEFVNINNKRIRHFYHVYDFSGAFLGKIKGDNKHLFCDSNGDYIFEYIDPRDFPFIKLKSQNPFIIFRKINL